MRRKHEINHEREQETNKHIAVVRFRFNVNDIKPCSILSLLHQTQCSTARGFGVLGLGLKVYKVGSVRL